MPLRRCLHRAPGIFPLLSHWSIFPLPTFQPPLHSSHSQCSSLPAPRLPSDTAGETPAQPLPQFSIPRCWGELGQRDLLSQGLRGGQRTLLGVCKSQGCFSTYFSCRRSKSPPTSEKFCSIPFVKVSQSKSLLALCLPHHQT